MGKKSILFVDDDTNLLSGLKRLLRSLHEDWDLHFISDPEQAVIDIGQGHYDVIITDMRMPKVDGSQVVQAAKLSSPESVRIVLTGQAEFDCLLNTMGKAHRFLSKPCDSELLKQVILGTRSYANLLEESELRPIILNVEQLPCSTKQFDQLSSLCESPEVKIEQICALATQDLSLAANLVRFSSSALCGPKQLAATGDQAARHLGLEAVKKLSRRGVLCATFVDPVFETYLRRLTSAANERLAQAETLYPDLEKDEAQIVCLFQDVAKIVLYNVFGADYRVIIAESIKNPHRELELERECFGTTHCEVGALMLGLWGLSDRVVSAVQGHHGCANTIA